MTPEQIILSAVALLVTIVGYFLGKTMAKLDKTADVAYKASNELNLLKQKTESDIKLLKQETGSKHERLEEKLDELKESIVELTAEIKVLNKR